eukprot:TRINITY_DN1529_c0_g1_i4.p1 TRINITY_DN1529_c0_g1~~TRINITY_DN1529_c0_g1_i4.p1  ORF type:complete len:112 (+),score=17.44 TRINITY_DN1529_c0_g1_i4:27-338(+)
MIIQLVFVFIATVGCGSVADATLLRSYPMHQVALTPEIRAEFHKLNRYCRPNYGYNYGGGYSSGGFNLGSLLGPAVFGLAAVGGFSLVNGLLNSGTPTVTVGK